MHFARTIGLIGACVVGLDVAYSPAGAQGADPDKLVITCHGGNQAPEKVERRYVFEIVNAAQGQQVAMSLTSFGLRPVKMGEYDKKWELNEASLSWDEDIIVTTDKISVISFPSIMVPAKDSPRLLEVFRTSSSASDFGGKLVRTDLQKYSPILTLSTFDRKSHSVTLSQIASDGALSRRALQCRSAAATGLQQAAADVRAELEAKLQSINAAAGF